MSRLARKGNVMNKCTSLVMLLFIGFLSLSAAYAQEQVLKPTPQKNIVLKGKWTFTSSSSGNHYGGDIEIKLDPADDNGVYHGKVSYDGYQTDDGCSTKSGFSDKPVDAETIRVGSNYRLRFTLNCPRGRSPRPYDWELVYGADGVYTRDFSNKNGVGIISVKQLE